MFFFQAEDGIRDWSVTGVQTCALPISTRPAGRRDVGVEEFEKLWKDKKGTVLDVRTAKEFEAGHISGAVEVDGNSAEVDKKVAGAGKEKAGLVRFVVGGGGGPGVRENEWVEVLATGQIA